MDENLQQLPFNRASDIESLFNNDVLDINNLNINPIDTINDKFDHTIFSKIDPDIHANHTNESLYYDERTFNDNFHDINNLSFIHINICSIPKNFKNFEFFLTNLKHKFPIVCCSESWFKESSKDRYTPKGFNHIYDFRPKKRGGGTSIFIRNEIQYETREDLKLDIHVNLTNSCFIEIDGKSINNKRNILIGCLYKPPHLSITHFNDKFEILLNTITQENKDIYLLGDFNINLADKCSNNLQTQEFRNILLSHGLSPLIHKATRIRNQYSSQIDHILTNVSIQNILCAGLFATRAYSDHFPIFCIIKNVSVEKRKKIILRRLFTQKNISKFKKHLSGIDWNSINMSTDVNDAFNLFQGIIHKSFSTCFPEIISKITYNNRYPWLTTALRNSIIEKNKLSLETVLQPENVNLFKQYKKYRNKLTSLLKNAELQYNSKQLEVNKSDLSKSWKIIKDITGLQSSKPVNASFNINDRIVTNGLMIANEFNNFFINIGPQLASSIQSTINPLLYVNSILNSIVIPVFSEYDVRQTVLSIKNTAAGYDQFSATVGKQCIDSYIIPLTCIINMSFNSGVCPDLLKVARVIPIYKSGDKKLVTNYRPISVLTFFSKIFEKLMYKCITDFMNDNDIIFKNQFGFRQKHSTQHAVISLVNNITNSLDSGNVVIGVFIDLKKTFDTVDHNILLKKVYSYGIRGAAYSWLASYLSHRKQYVLYDGNKSDIHTVTCGVPQGSILGPLLFIIYVNDICNVSDLLYKILYADDTSVLLSGTNYSNLIETMNNELSLLNSWLLSNKLSLNVQKSYYMVFHRGKLKTCQYNLVINDIQLTEVKSIKYLGLIIDNKLKWIDHISHVKNKISRGIGIIRKAKAFVNKKCLHDLYYSFIYPYFLYCIEVWGNAVDSHLQPLCTLQNKIIRLVSFSYFRAHADTLFIKLEILPLHKIFLHRISLMMYKYTHNMLPPAMNEMYIRNDEVHNYNTRQSKLLHIPNGSHIKNFRYRSVLLYNELIARNINFNVSLPKFKKIVKRFLLHNIVQLGY